jgi:hypothetical protein
MNGWRKYPVIYEINTWVWLSELSRTYGKPVTLATVPDQQWDALAMHGFDAVWFMGVWERSPAGIAISMKNEGLLTDFRRALPDFSPEDNVGSPYCVRRYVVDQHLGGPEGLAAARKQLAKRGLRLILDFVPNHVAPDHPWVKEHPEYFVQGSADDLAQKPGEFFQAGGKVLALGRDPFFAPWPDVIQFNGFHPGLRKAITETVGSIAAQCDGMRCDMAMLLMTPIFERTWGPRAGSRPEQEYWSEVIQGVKSGIPMSSSSLRPTGTRNGSCSNRDLITATISGSTIVLSMIPPRPYDCISAPICPTRRSWCASSRITTNRVPPRRSEIVRRGLRL